MVHYVRLDLISARLVHRRCGKYIFGVGAANLLLDLFVAAGAS